MEHLKRNYALYLCLLLFLALLAFLFFGLRKGFRVDHHWTPDRSYAIRITNGTGKPIDELQFFGTYGLLPVVMETRHGAPLQPGETQEFHFEPLPQWLRRDSSKVKLSVSFQDTDEATHRAGKVHIAAGGGAVTDLRIGSELVLLCAGND